MRLIKRFVLAAALVGLVALSPGTTGCSDELCAKVVGTELIGVGRLDESGNICTNTTVAEIQPNSKSATREP